MVESDLVMACCVLSLSLSLRPIKKSLVLLASCYIFFTYLLNIISLIISSFPSLSSYDSLIRDQPNKSSQCLEIMRPFSSFSFSFSFSFFSTFARHHEYERGCARSALVSNISHSSPIAMSILGKRSDNLAQNVGSLYSR